jgi:hypothetical protein
MPLVVETVPPQAPEYDLRFLLHLNSVFFALR